MTNHGRGPGWYQLSPYDQVLQKANPKYKASSFRVNDHVNLDQLKLIQYAFDIDT